MFTEERLQQILNMLNETGRVKVKELSERFNVSEGMIRKDLQKLEKNHSIQRTYGGAILNREIVQITSISTRMNLHSDSKKIIAEKAFDIIEDGDIIFLDASSINFLLAKLLANSSKPITLITNMPMIPALFTNNESVTLACLGGSYDKKSGSLFGSEVIKSINRYNFNKGFIGSSGVNVSTGSICTVTLEDGNVKEAVIANSKQAFLLVEKEKFHVDGTYKFACLSDIHGLVSNSDLNEDIKEKLKKSDVEIF